MKLHIVTVGEPKLPFAKQGWETYYKRLGRFHQLRTTRIPDKYAYAATYILERAGKDYLVALVIAGEQLTSPALAQFLEQRAQQTPEICLLIGGPEGLPQAVVEAANYRWSLSKLTLPHDLAMVVVLEALYRASTITAGHPYHK